MRCNCEQNLRLELRTVMYTRNVMIRHVPVLVCDHCLTYELIPSMKSDLKKYVDAFSKQPGKISLSLTDYHELADLIYEVLAEGEYSEGILMSKLEYEIGERINLLLDLYKMAEKMQDEDWVRDIRERLSQLSVSLPEMSVMHADA
ncbi:hypothetical protein [Paenibacillus azoreducens]|uniref:YgiT-type zinc finger protein n=1 Tax=Paenibacillus azoreducens TaxID=116718 RepID=A0A920CSW8_9BACL|nr:hypothetical protein [Paenibacillus azoreducens]GIO49750.1 hypothetical protein J34TS1_45150 [Paenibacillus azoreducens]